MMSKQTNTVGAVAQAEAATKKAEELVASLRQRLVAHDEAGAQLIAERGEISFKVHGDGNPQARVRLSEINNQLIVHASERESLVAALKEAEARFEMARGIVAREQRRVAIREQQKLSRQFRELGPFLDRATENLRKGLIALKANAPVVGRDFRHVQTLHRVLSVALFDTPFRDHFGVPDSNDRRTFSNFSGVINGWCDSADANLKHELASLDGEKATEAA
jgi:hypothetical protein